MQRDEASLLDIASAGNRVLQYAQGLSKVELSSNTEKQSAILYQIIVLGEAAKRLSPEFRHQHPAIPWKRIAGMRDIIAHQYDRIDIDILWDVIHTNIPDLLPMLEPLLTPPES
jgi:uncharacterized protein with HEPN domain